MSRSPACTPEEKLRIVLDILANRMALGEASARAGVSTTSIGNWKRQFLRAAGEGLAAGSSARTGELAALQAENRRLTEQVREAVVLLKVWQMSARARHPGD